jgi:predicted  nucleic acid-binding Zn-ribbon protein
VSLEWFSRLKEYDSLSRSRMGFLNSIKDQEKRIEVLTNRKEDNLAQLSGLKADYIRLQQSLHELEQKLRIQTEQRSRWIDSGGDEAKRKSMEAELSKLEEDGFILLQKLDENERERQDIQTFLQGLEKTILEISLEAKNEITLFQNEITQIDLRLSGLIEILPGEFKDLLMKLLKKNLAHGPFTRMEEGSCFFCRYKISRVVESEIDTQKLLRQCPQCSRIFIPYGT